MARATAAVKPTGRFRREAEGPYSLSASITFLEGFAPASYGSEDADRLRMAFVTDGLDGGERVAGVLVRSDGGSGVAVDTYGEAAPEAVRGQLERILSLDADGRGFPGVGERDPVVGGLQGRYPGLRPVLFWSPYEAAAWAIVGNRIRIAQAAKVKARMAEELGEEVEVAGARERAFPGPSRLATLEGFPGLSGRKAEWLRALARAAEEGKLEASRLRSMPADRADRPPRRATTGVSKPKDRSADRRSCVERCRSIRVVKGHKGQGPVIGAQTAVIGGYPIARKAYLSRKVAPCGR